MNPAFRENPISRLRVLVDFDGTLVGPNVAIELVGKFGRDGERVAKEVDLELHAGRMTLRRAWELQAALLPGDRIPEMTQFAVDSVPLRPGAKEFLSLMRQHSIPVTIVSGGLRFYIDAVLRRESLDLPVLSDNMAIGPNGELQVFHPHGHATCRLCGICKAQSVRTLGNGQSITVFLGDGSTDRYAAEVADVVFARHRLLKQCQTRGIPCLPFDDFPPVTQKFERWIAGSESIPIRSQLGSAASECPISQDLANAASSPLAGSTGPEPA